MGLENWTNTLKSNLEAVSGIGPVFDYDELPGAILLPKTLLILPRSGSGSYSMGGPNLTYYRVDLALYHPGQILGEAYAVLAPFIKLVRDKIYSDVTLGGLVAHCLTVAPPEAWFDGPGQLMYGDKTHTGIIFRLIVKEAEALTVSA